MITCKNIFKSYDKLQVLKGVSLEISKGDLVCIVGPSGAGKSTLLHIIGTLDKADSGFVSINGQDIAALKDNSLSKFRNEYLGFVFQFYNRKMNAHTVHEYLYSTSDLFSNNLYRIF